MGHRSARDQDDVSNISRDYVTGLIFFVNQPDKAVDLFLVYCKNKKRKRNRKPFAI